MTEKVVVTGLGAVTPVGLGVPEYWKGLVEGRSGIGAVTCVDASRLPSRIAGELKGFTGISPLYSGCGLNFSASTYHDTMGLAFTSDRTMMPDPEFMRECLDKAMDQLQRYLKTKARGSGTRRKKIAGKGVKTPDKTPRTGSKRKKPAKKSLAA